MSARDLIARACCHDPDECVMGTGSISTAGTSSFKCYQRAWEQQLPRANAILSALTAAGYRLIGPGELDQETIERCAVIVADASADIPRHKLSAALRALQSQEAGNEG